MAAASGLINFLRTIAGAIATAVTLSAWSTDAVISRSNLVGRLNLSHDLMGRLDGGLGLDQALHSLDELVQSQSIMLATNHMFLLLGTVVALTAAAIWLMPRPATSCP
jgi:DHA2 family multidrug resistance protein